MVISLSLIAMKHSIRGQCFSLCFDASHLNELLKNETVINELNLEKLEGYNKSIEDIKTLLCDITDPEQRVQAESQIKDLQMIIHALIIKNRQNDESDDVGDEVEG